MLWKIIRLVGYPLTWLTAKKHRTVHPKLEKEDQCLWINLGGTNGNKAKTIPAIYIEPKNTNSNYCIVSIPGQGCTMNDAVFIDRFFELLDATGHSGLCVDPRNLTYKREGNKAILNQVSIDKEVAQSARKSGFDTYLNDMVACLQQVSEQKKIDGFIFAAHSLGALKISALTEKIKKENIQLPPIICLFLSISLIDFFSGVWTNVQAIATKKVKPLSYLLSNTQGRLAKAFRRWFESNDYQIKFSPSAQIPTMVTGFTEGDLNIPEEIAMINGAQKMIHEKKQYPHITCTRLHIDPKTEEKCINSNKHNALPSMLQVTDRENATELSIFCEFVKNSIEQHERTPHPTRH